MSNEKTWRGATWELTGYKSDRFFKPGTGAPIEAPKTGDKLVDTLVQIEKPKAPESLAQKWRVETKSEIRPYVVRDHAWSIVQHDEMNNVDYQKDAPDGYTERMDYQPDPYNKPYDSASSSASKV